MDVCFGSGAPCSFPRLRSGASSRLEGALFASHLRSPERGHHRRAASKAAAARLAQAGWWLPATIVGWTLAAGSAAVADQGPRALSLRGLPGAAVYLALALSGG